MTITSPLLGPQSPEEQETYAQEAEKFDREIESAALETVEGARISEAPIPPFSRCPTCAAVAMLLRPGKPVVCAQCSRVISEAES